MSFYTFTLFTILFSFAISSQAQWIKTSDITSNDNVFDIVISNTGAVFASSWVNGVYKSTNDGDSWELSGLPGARVYDLAVSPEGDIFAFATTTSNHSIHRSTDDGLTWSEVYNGSHQNNFAFGGGVVFKDSIAVAAMSFTLGPLIGNIGVDIVKSTDYGATWQFVIMLNGLGFANDLTLLDDGRIFVASSLNGVCFSSDMGSTWFNLPSFPQIFTEKVLYHSNGNVYLGRNTAGSGDDLLFKSTNKGNSWLPVGILTNTSGGNLNSIYIDDNDVIYVPVVKFGPTYFTVYRSSDDGLTWDEIYDGFPPSTNIRALTGKGNILFAGTEGRGVYKRVIPVPVELSSFTASVNNNDVILHWSTASETNNMGFEIQRLQNYNLPEGKAGVTKLQDWETVGFVEGKGTTTEQQFYSFVDENLSSGKYQYRLKQIDFNGSFEYQKTIVEAEIIQPSEFLLKQNYPNPFNPTTTISFVIGQQSFVSLKVYDVLGNEVAVLVNEEKTPGSYKINFDARDLSSGIYLYKLTTGTFSETKRMMLLK